MQKVPNLPQSIKLRDALVGFHPGASRDRVLSLRRCLADACDECDRRDLPIWAMLQAVTGDAPPPGANGFTVMAGITPMPSWMRLIKLFSGLLDMPLPPWGGATVAAGRVSDFPDRDLNWRTKSGHCAGPPPRPLKRVRRPLRQTGAPESSKLNSGAFAGPNLIDIAEHRQARSRATASCALNDAEILGFEALGLDPADRDDIAFAVQVCALWQCGPRALTGFLSELACRRLLRTEIEHLLADWLDQEGEA